MRIGNDEKKRKGVESNDNEANADQYQQLIFEE